MSSVSNELAADAERFSLDPALLQELGQTAIAAKDRAHCMYGLLVFSLYWYLVQSCELVLHFEGLPSARLGPFQ